MLWKTLWKVWKTHHFAPQSTTSVIIISKNYMNYKHFYKKYRKTRKNFFILRVLHYKFSADLAFCFDIFPQSYPERGGKPCFFLRFLGGNVVEKEFLCFFVVWKRRGKAAKFTFFPHACGEKKSTASPPKRRLAVLSIKFYSSFSSISATPWGRYALTSSPAAIFARTSVELKPSKRVSETSRSVSTPKCSLL